MRIDVDLDDLKPSGVAAALSVATGKSSLADTLDWAIVGPLLEQYCIELTYHGVQELKVRSRHGRSEPDTPWSASIGGFIETGASAIEASAKAILAKLLPLNKVPLPSKSIVRYLQDTYPIMDAVLNGSSSHLVTQDADNINIYRITSPSLGRCEDSLDHILDLAKLVREFSITEIEYAEVNGQKTVSSFLIEHG